MNLKPVLSMKDLVKGHKYSIKSIDYCMRPWSGIGTFDGMADEDGLYTEGTGKFLCEDPLVWNAEQAGFFGIEEIVGEIIEPKSVDPSKIKSISSINDLVVNKNYVIHSIDKDGITPWNGVATFQGIADNEFPKNGCGYFICEDGVECAFQFDHVVGELVEDPIVTVERNRCIQAVKDEPEMPDEMPDAVWDVISTDKDAAQELFRIAIRQTKTGIINRINRNLV